MNKSSKFPDLGNVSVKTRKMNESSKFPDLGYFSVKNHENAWIIKVSGFEPRTSGYREGAVVVVLEMARYAVLSEYPLAHRKDTHMQLYA